MRRLLLPLAILWAGTSYGQLDDPNAHLANDQATTEDIDTSQQEAELDFALSEQIRSINNDYSSNALNLQSQIAQAQLAKGQCDASYADQAAQAEAQAAQGKAQAQQGLGSTVLPSLLNPALMDGLGNLLSKEETSEKDNFERKINAYNGMVKEFFEDYPVDGSADQFTKNTKTGADNGRSARGLDNLCNKLTSTTHGATADPTLEQKKQECLQEAEQIAEESQHMDFYTTPQYHTNQNAAGSTSGALITTAATLGLGLWGYNNQKKAFEDAKEAQLDGAERALDSCSDAADLQINTLQAQLGELARLRDDAIAAAKQSNALALNALETQRDLAQSANNTGPDPFTPDANVQVDPASLDDGELDSLLASGPTIGDPESPFGADSTSDLGSNSDGSGGGSAGAGGAGGGSGSSGSGNKPWSFGSSYPAFAGGGGLPKQPGKGKWGGANGTSGFGGGGFGDSDFQFGLAPPTSAEEYEAGQVAGDGGLLNLFARARQRLSAHVPELINNQSLRAIASQNKNKKDEPPKDDEGASKEAKVQRATASRLR